MVQYLLAEDESTGESHPLMKYRHPWPKHPRYGIPTELWPTVVQRVLEQKKPLRTIAAEYGVSYETIRCIMHHVQKQRGQLEA